MLWEGVSVAPLTGLRVGLELLQTLGLGLPVGLSVNSEPLVTSVPFASVPFASAVTFASTAGPQYSTVSTVTRCPLWVW